jgi:hypothetical protein
MRKNQIGKDKQVGYTNTFCFRYSAPTFTSLGIRINLSLEKIGDDLAIEGIDSKASGKC